MFIVGAGKPAQKVLYQFPLFTIMGKGHLAYPITFLSDRGHPLKRGHATFFKLVGK